MLYDAGSIAKISLLQLQAQLAGDKYLLVQTQNAIRQNTLVLKQLLQLPADSSFDIVTPAVVELLGIIPPLSNVQQTAHDIFPEIQIGKLGWILQHLIFQKPGLALNQYLVQMQQLAQGTAG